MRFHHNIINENEENIELKVLINVHDVQCMMDSFFSISGIPMAIIDLKGEVLVGVGWQEICTKFHRVHPVTQRNCFESDLKLTAEIPEGEFKLYRCRNGMWDMATPLFIGERKIGNLFMGQFFFSDEKIDYGFFAKQASRYNFNESEYLTVLNKVPRLDRENVNNAKSFFIKLAASLSQLGCSNMKLSKAITETQKKEIELKESREKLSMALEVGSIGIWEWNNTTGDIHLDHKTTEMLGLKNESFVAKYSDIEKLINEEDIAHFRKAVRNSVCNGASFETIFRLRHRHGKTRHLNARANVYEESNGRSLRMLGVCFDITGLKEGTESLISKLNEELLRSNKELESFAYVASHDLQEPLRMISGFTQLLEKQYSNRVLDETAHEYITYTVDGAKRMFDLINGLLAYSRIHTKGKEFTEVDIKGVIDSVKSNLRLSLKDLNVSIYAENLPVVCADENQMIQLFQNLILNGIKFNERKPEIHITCVTGKNHHQFSVKDNGIGLESIYFERIFQIFQRLQPRDKYDGTGIGLSICKRIVERHGGRIWVESQPGEGSVFSFSICR